MTTLIKSILLLCILFLGQIQIAESLHTQGEQLAALGNAAHRPLGLMYAAYMLQPHREDFVSKYIIEWYMATHGDRIIEGTTVPTIPLMASYLRMEHPENQQVERLSKFLIQNRNDWDWKVKVRKMLEEMEEKK